jgi:hypothetical protein
MSRYRSLLKIIFKVIFKVKGPRSFYRIPIAPARDLFNRNFMDISPQ